MAPALSGDSAVASNYDPATLLSSFSSDFLPAAYLQSNFDFMGSIGQGQYGRVWKCMSRVSGRYYACKQIKKARLTNGRIHAVFQEISTMQRLRGHQNVVELDSVYEDATSVFLLMELLPSGDLFQQISTRSGLPEREARDVFRAVAEAVKHCHGNGVVHRDIKPENILLRALSSPISVAGCALTESDSSTETPSLECGCFRGYEWDVKLADFGLAKRIPDSGTVKGCVGSFPYEAPEVLASQEYDFSADIWSLGVLLYAMLSANWPEFKDNKRVLDECKDWTHPLWGLISDAPKQLIRRMMSVDPNQRPTIDEILEHEWFSRECVDVLCPSTLNVVSLGNQPLAELAETAILPAFSDSTSSLAPASSSLPRDAQTAAGVAAPVPAEAAAAAVAASPAAVIRPHLLNAIGDFGEDCSVPDRPPTPARLATMSSCSSCCSSVSSSSCCSSDACSICARARDSGNMKDTISSESFAVRRVRTLNRQASDDDSAAATNEDRSVSCVNGNRAHTEGAAGNGADDTAQQQERNAAGRKPRRSGRLGSMAGWAMATLWGVNSAAATASSQEQTERFNECSVSLPLLRLR
ncbi:hypothetical protein CLOM_g16364 [Closterium sp. NIES-68]|nr:hypothetical protein CLOM_g16364 [Closterium sp. NIES-68]GJP79419.1 hypothetical protein CLOP_g9653 [Closterium sp. NIES-67]